MSTVKYGVEARVRHGDQARVRHGDQASVKHGGEASAMYGDEAMYGARAKDRDGDSGSDHSVEATAYANDYGAMVNDRVDMKSAHSCDEIENAHTAEEIAHSVEESARNRGEIETAHSVTAHSVTARNSETASRYTWETGNAAWEIGNTAC